MKKKRWDEALDVLLKLDADEELSPLGLDALANTARMLCRTDLEMTAGQKAYTGHVADGDAKAAANSACWVAHAAFNLGKITTAKGWQKTAKRALGDSEGTDVHAWLERLWLKIYLAEGDPAKAELHRKRFEQAAELCGSFDVLALVRVDSAMAALKAGRAAEAFERLDDEIAFAVGGQASEIVTINIYCNVLDACHIAQDMRRGKEWSAEASDWCERNNCEVFSGLCRIRNAQVHRFTGDWDQAEKSILSACERFKDRAWDLQAAAHHELGIQRMRRGDYGGAAKSFAKVQELGYDAQPGYALLLMETGDLQGAAESIKAALEGRRGGRMLPEHLESGAVEVFAAAGWLNEARAVCEALDKKAEDYQTTVMLGAAATAQAILAAAEERYEDALDGLRTAVSYWQESEAPFDLARNSLITAEVMRMAGMPIDAAIVARLEAAKSTFTRLGAAPDAARVSAILEPAESDRGHAVILFTDICKSSQLVEALGDAAWSRMLRWHDQTIQETCVRSGGEVIKHTGDGYLLVFESGSAAVQCGREIQRAFDANRKEHGFAPQVRIGLHCGEVERRDGDVFGKAVHEAARIMGLAGPDEIVVSQTVLSGCPGLKASGAKLEELRGISEPVQVAFVDWRG